MDTVGHRNSLIGLEVPFSGFIGFPGQEAQAFRQNLVMKYTGIPFGDPGAPAVTGRKLRLLRHGMVFGAQRGL